MRATQELPAYTPPQRPENGVPAVAVPVQPQGQMQPPEQLPSYRDSVRWAVKNSLRPAFIVSQIVCIIVAVILMISHFRMAREYDGLIRVLSLVSGFMFIVCLVVHLFGLVSAITGARRGLLLLRHLFVPSLLVALAAQVIQLVGIARSKSAFLTVCKDTAYEMVSDPESTLDDAECEAEWRETIVWNTIWTIVIIIFGVLFLLLMYRYTTNTEPLADTQPMPPLDSMSDTYAMADMHQRPEEQLPEHFGELDEHDQKIIDAKTDYPHPPDDPPAWEAASSSRRL